VRLTQATATSIAQLTRSVGNWNGVGDLRGTARDGGLLRALRETTDARCGVDGTDWTTTRVLRTASRSGRESCLPCARLLAGRGMTIEDRRREVNKSDDCTRGWSRACEAEGRTLGIRGLRDLSYVLLRGL
jgi:hypothetical protein